MKTGRAPRTFQDLIFALQHYWAEQGCVILQPYDMEVGAGTFHTATFLRAIGPGALARRLRAALAPPDRRALRREPVPPAALLPVPGGDQTLAAATSSICTSAASRRSASIRWCTTCASSRTTGSRPTLGAWGLGWEVWLNGMEVTQFTYFQQVGGLDCRPVTGEITYGLERLAMYLQGVESIYDIVWSDGPRAASPIGDVFHQNEVEQSAYNFEHADVPMLLRHFEDHERACQRAAGREARAARLRAGAQGLAHLQPARCAPRHLGDRAPALHPARAHARERRGAAPTTRAARRSAFRCCRTPAARRRRAVMKIEHAISWSSSAPRSCRRRRCSTLQQALVGGACRRASTRRELGARRARPASRRRGAWRCG